MEQSGLGMQVLLLISRDLMDQSISQQFEKFNAHGKLPSPRGVALQVIHLTEQNEVTASK